MNNLYTKIRDEITIRKQTLQKIKTLPLPPPVGYNFNEEDKAFFYVQAIPMIYAVWEGFMRVSFEEYRKKINTLKIAPETINDSITRYTLEYKIINYPNATERQQNTWYKDISNFFSQEFVELKILIDTGSNLGFSEANKILEVHGLKLLEQYELVSNIPEAISDEFFPHLKASSKYPIEGELSGSKQESKENNLLNLRNGIAHGNPSAIPIYPAHIDRFIFLVEFLIDRIFEKIQEGYEAQTYLKEEFRAGKLQNP